ncbi:nitrogen permease regulator 3 [Rhodotorula toruloides]|uniref:Nitrogen permease regulator 3 n=1 Tax=Rhodotorula toruloides TaxID=5286 RepID=A0A511KMJ4_RHOTO|nr:nitrogen permease regulator 3 [Rhodotorula toruloides]
MASLLALLLVAKSSAGAQLVYAYPSAPKAVPRTHKPLYLGRRKISLHPDYNESSSSSDESSESDDDEYHGPDSKQYLGFPDPVLASLLTPSRELCDQPFELVVDHLAFVGHPVWLGDDEGTRDRLEGSAKEAGDQEKRGTETEDDEDERGRSRMLRKGSMAVGSAEDDDEVRRVDRDQTVGPPTSREASLPPHARALLISEREDSPPPRRPDALAHSHSSASTLHPGTSLASSQHSHNSLGAGRLVSFNLLCVIDTPPDSHLSSHLEGYYKDVVVPVTANIKALEKKDTWLTKEAVKLRRMREGALERDTPWDEFLATLPARSSLAGAISQLYTSLRANKLASVHFGPLPVQVLFRGELPADDEVDLRDHEEYLLPDKGDDSNSPERRNRSVSPSGHAFPRTRQAPLFSTMRRRPPVQFEPWQTLLLLEDARMLHRDVLEGSLLWRFLDICRPTLSFADYETLLDLYSEDHMLEDIVDHLVYWKKARVVDLVSLKGAYALSTEFPVKQLPSIVASFGDTFPALPPLPVLLSQLSPAEPFASIVPSAQRASHLNALVWLLQHEVVEKQRTYVRIVASEEIKRATSAHWASGKSGVSGTESMSVSSSRPDDVGVLSTSASAASDRSFGTNRSESCGSAGGSGGKAARQPSVRPDFDDARGMTMVSDTTDPLSPRVGLLSTSARSATMSVRRTRTPRNQQGHRSKGLSTATYSSHSDRPDETALTPTVIVEPGRPSMLESRWLSEMCRDKDKVIVDKFERIIRMLNGRHHLDEIRFRAQLSRKHLQSVLSTFEDHLILFTHT